jgi:hypothetical protein
VLHARSFAAPKTTADATENRSLPLAADSFAAGRLVVRRPAYWAEQAAPQLLERVPA